MEATVIGSVFAMALMYTLPFEVAFALGALIAGAALRDSIKTQSTGPK